MITGGKNMSNVQIATRVDNKEKLIFEQTAKSLGITPAIALKIFISKFNAEHGFPFEVKQTPAQRGEAFKNEQEVMDFIEEIGGELYAD
jgi:addiction module RelB/DinJ family antitoxin